ncbi:MAG: hypothetical protein QM729_21485 [Solirubrobacterales bacterium]
MSNTKVEVKPTEVKPAEPTKNEALDLAMEAIARLLPGLSASSALAAVQALQASQPAAPVSTRGRAYSPVCMDCGQHTSACNGKHVEMVVYPVRNPEHARFFRGVILNGKEYLSNHSTHAIVVPECAESFIQNTIDAYVRNEVEVSMGRVKERFSGTIGPKGSNLNPNPADGWR